MDPGRDPREGLNYLFGVDCYQVVGMCFCSIILYPVYIYTHTCIYKLAHGITYSNYPVIILYFIQQINADRQSTVARWSEYIIFTNLEFDWLNGHMTT